MDYYFPTPTARTYSPRSKTEIVSFDMIRSGGYQQQFMRPWTTAVGEDQLNSIVGRVNMMGSPESITPGTFKNVASSALSLAAQPIGRVPIVNGWAEPRIRWVMRVRITRPSGAQYWYVLRGYTSHMGVSDNGHIDPNMLFYINDIVQVGDINMGDHIVQTAQGAVQFVDGRTLNNAFGTDVYTMRPLDIFAGISGMGVENEYRVATGEAACDLSYRFNGRPMLSNRSNCAPTNVFSKVLKAMLTSQHLANFGQDDASLVDRARSLLPEHAPEDNPLLRAIGNAKNQNGQDNTFTFANLAEIDSNVSRPEVTKYHSLSSFDVGRLRRAEDSPPTTGADQTTIAVETLCRVIPALMAESLLQGVSFISNNHRPGGLIMTLPTADIVPFGNVLAESTWRSFVTRLEDEVLRDIIAPGTTFDLTASVRLDNEADIRLKLDADPELHVFYPTAFDNLLSPTYTTDRTNFHNVVNDMDRLRIAVSHGIDRAVGTPRTPFSAPTNF